MSKLLIIGIDGMDREYIADNIEHLPNFQRIIAASPCLKSTSVFPPDSDTAWASIYTGLNPAKHGVVEFVDPLERKKITMDETEYLDTSVIRKKTFWDIAAKDGNKVCAVFPHIAYPVWDINNGFMINPHPKTGELQYCPSDFNFNFNFEDFEILKKIPRTKFEFQKYLEKKISVVKNEFQFGINMLKNYSWDLFFFYSSGLDSIMHIYWNYCDPNDPTFPGEDNPLRNAILDFHILYDQLVCKMLDCTDSKVTCMILSDHGHAMRPVNLFNINEVLRREGYLFEKSGRGVKVLSFVEKMKRMAVNLAQWSGLRPIAQTVLRTFPALKEMYTTPSTIDFNKTLAHCTDLSGLKSYSYGGIKLYNDKFNTEEEYLNAKKHIIALLSEYKIPNSDESVFKWICPKEEVYKGKYIDKYPDIVFDLHPEYGSGWAVDVDTFTKTGAHKFFPGSHRGDTPILYLINMGERAVKHTNVTLMDIAPTILDILNINVNDQSFDGHSILTSK